MATTITAGTTTTTAFTVTPDTTGNLAFKTQAGTNTITVPNTTGTLALTSQLPYIISYLVVAGGGSGGRENWQSGQGGGGGAGGLLSGTIIFNSRNNLFFCNWCRWRIRNWYNSRKCW